MVYDVYSKWNDETKPWLSLILSGLAFFTYFFRTKFSKKFEGREKQNNSKQP
jgi:hypothetical protein